MSASVRAAVHTNSRVMHEREEQLAYVEAAYRDPRRAKNASTSWSRATDR